LDSVVRTIVHSAGDVDCSADGRTVRVDGEVIPFVPLSRVLDGTDAAPELGGHAVVVRAAGRNVALGVERVVRTKPFVVRRLPSLMVASAAVAGAVLDACGDPELILDPEQLVREALERRLPLATVGAAVRIEPILVVDDSITTRMLEQSILESAGYEVEIATSGQEALERARAGPHALFLVDVEMPGMDGFTFIERARADPRVGSVPAVLVSSRSASEDLARAKAVGASGYVVKDEFDQRKLLAMIGELVGP
jgi:two-component system chemotaxis sensor kinase CheA